jgi:hypothetical protein
MNSRKTKESNIDKKYREIVFQYSIEDIKESKTPEFLSMSFPVPSALLAGKEARRKQGALLCSGLRIEGASGSSVSMLGLVIARQQWSSQCS